MSRRLTTWILGFLLAWGATAQPPTDPGVIWDEFPAAGPLEPTDRFLLAQGVQGSQPNPFLANLTDVVTLVIEELTAPGSDTWVIFNDGGEYGADAGFAYNKTTDTVTITGGFTISPSLLAAVTATGPALVDSGTAPTVLPDRSLTTTGLWSGLSGAQHSVGLMANGSAGINLIENSGVTGVLWRADSAAFHSSSPDLSTVDTDPSTVAGEEIFTFQFRSVDDIVNYPGARMDVAATADWTGGVSHPAEVTFHTTPVGGTSPILALTITDTQELVTPVDVVVDGVSVCLEDGTNCPAVAPGVTDKIEEGDSSVEVVDLGTGEVQVDIDGVNKVLVTLTTTTVDNSLVVSGASTTVENELILADEALLYFQDGDTNTVSLRAPADLTSDRSCVFEDDAHFIPDSCVGDGVDGGGLETTDIDTAAELDAIVADASLCLEDGTNCPPGTPGLASYYETKCINIDPDFADSDYLFFRAEEQITIGSIDCLVVGATSVDLTAKECDSSGASCSNIEAAITCTTAGATEASGIDNATVDAGDWLRVSRGTSSGLTPPTQATLCVNYVVGSTKTKCITIDPDHPTTDWLMWRVDVPNGIVISGIDCLTVNGTSVALTVKECDGSGGTCSNIEAAITCSTTAATEASGVDNSSVDSGDWIRVERGTPSGAVDQASVCVNYVEN